MGQGGGGMDRRMQEAGVRCSHNTTPAQPLLGPCSQQPQKPTGGQAGVYSHTHWVGGGGRQDQTRDKVLAQAGQQPFPRPLPLSQEGSLPTAALPPHQ